MNGVLNDDERELIERRVRDHWRQQPVTARWRYYVKRIGERLVSLGERLQGWAE